MTTAVPVAPVAILDTCVFSYLYDDRPEAAPYKPHLEGVIPAVAFPTIGELYKGAFNVNWSQESLARLEGHLERFLIIQYDTAVAIQWARIQTARRGRIYPANDAWIAACALTFDCTLLSHNRRDFHDIPGLKLVCYAPPLPV